MASLTSLPVAGNEADIMDRWVFHFDGRLPLDEFFGTLKKESSWKVRGISTAI